MSRALRTRVMRWPSADAARIGDVDVKVYAASLLADDDRLEHAVSVLSRPERERYSAYSNGVVARRFAMGRAILREILGALQGAAPGSVPLFEGAFGKPVIARGSGSLPLWFSVAHCDDVLLVAVSREGDVGVDVERTRPIECWERVADRTLAPAERAQLLRSVERGEPADLVFLRHWCRVEAELKALGCGIHGIEEHRTGRRVPGMRVADLPALPLPADIAAGTLRYQGAVAVCASSDAIARHSERDRSQQTTPTIPPTSASTP